MRITAVTVPRPGLRYLISPAASQIAVLLAQAVHGGEHEEWICHGGERAAEGNAHGILGQHVRLVADHDACAIISEFLDLDASA